MKHWLDRKTPEPITTWRPTIEDTCVWFGFSVLYGVCRWVRRLRLSRNGYLTSEAYVLGTIVLCVVGFYAYQWADQTLAPRLVRQMGMVGR